MSRAKYRTIFTLLYCAVIVISTSVCSASALVMPSVPDGVHFTYKSVSQEHALPQEFIDWVVSLMNKTGDESVVAQMIAGVTCRKIEGSQITGTVDYWGTNKYLMFAVMPRGEAYVFDGDKFALGGAAAIVPKYLKMKTNTRSATSLLKGSGRIDESVPYLGFYQPGKKLFTEQLELSQSNINNGKECIYRVANKPNQAYILKYDKQVHLIEIVNYRDYMKNIICDRYTFSHYQSHGSFSFPTVIIRERNQWFRDKKNRLRIFPDYTVRYELISANFDPIDRRYFALATARVGTQFEDARYQLPKSNGRILSYIYTNPNISIDETSKIEYNNILNEKKKNRSNGNYYPILIRICAVLVGIIIVGAKLYSIRRRKQ